MLTRPDLPKSGKIVTRPDPTCVSIRPVDSSGVYNYNLMFSHVLSDQPTVSLSNIQFYLIIIVYNYFDECFEITK